MIVDKAVYRDGVRQDCGDPSSELERCRTEGTGFLWIGLKDPEPEEFAAINAELALHPLAVEDAVTGNQRAKIEVYENLVFIVVKTLRYVDATSDVETGEVMLFAGDRFVLTVRGGEANPLAGVRRQLETKPAHLRRGPVAVVHAVLDLVVDTYSSIDVEIASDLSEIEDLVFRDDRSVQGTDIYRLKREVLEFKRAAVPMVAPLRRLIQGEAAFVDKKMRPFFRDVLDHLLQVTDHLESYDRLLSDILNAHLSQVSLRQNDDMRRISAWVAIAAVPTMIAGVYGMNFDNMPELHWEYSYFVVLALMVAVCLAMYAAFRRSGWL
ncbi:magnesium/cobalt transporter CorA [Gephyromycinifex aptenodytis]|uniref:magnesium/cobalt transporter CorA n=1 Tax=Gephyromycinifex aptenodytis TaxID=2716227 RepID=UPI0014479128|nr:magnesium/cobalt transporter CorA [Gephyromycinifex aptenodytis]